MEDIFQKLCHTKIVDEFLAIVKTLLIGSGNTHDVGLRLLILLTGCLSGIVAFYIKRDVKSYGLSLEKFASNLQNIDHNARDMSNSLESYKRALASLLSSNLESTRTEYHSVKNQILSLESKLSSLQISLKETNLNLTSTHGTREEMYALMKTMRQEIVGLMTRLSSFQTDKDQIFGRIIRIEEFVDRYEIIMTGLEKMLKHKKE